MPYQLLGVLLHIMAISGLSLGCNVSDEELRSASLEYVD